MKSSNNGSMGKAKKMKCKVCGYEWLQYEGIGLQGIEIDPKEDKDIIKCPQCNTIDVEPDEKEHILWD